jgi:predicted nucleic acid-binding protein
MIAYADTSALVKLFVVEEGSQATRDMLHKAWAIGTGLLTRAELGAALARGAQRGLFSEGEAQEVCQRLETVWPTWVHIGVDEDLAARAEEMAWTYKLRGYDAVHLAAALTWQDLLGYPVVLLAFDRELLESARRAGLATWPES